MQSFFFNVACGDETHIIFMDCRLWPTEAPKLIPINHQSELDDPDVLKAFQTIPEKLEGCMKFLHKGVSWSWLDTNRKFDVPDDEVDSIVQTLIRDGSTRNLYT